MCSGLNLYFFLAITMQKLTIKENKLIENLRQLLPPDRLRMDYIDTISFGPDAGFYSLIPKAIVKPINEDEIVSLFRISQAHHTPMVFRAGGTSLSGQAITDGILVDLSNYWNSIKIEDEGKSVRVKPGVTGGTVNAYLKQYHRKLGPDPSSINAAMIGGILSNNASGMCCGVKMNSYHTVEHIRFILPSGSTFSTECPDDYNRFKRDCGNIHSELENIRNEIIADKKLFEKIRRKYEIKNTVGYSLNAFIDYHDPMDILAHLLIGAEGSLAFISEAVIKTVPDFPCKSTALLLFPTISDACEAIGALIESGAAMTELMDRASLRAIEHSPAIPEIIPSLPQDGAALLVEFQDHTQLYVQQKVDMFLSCTNNLCLLNPADFTSDSRKRESLWKLRKGLFPSVGAVRARGTTVILEDLCFPVQHLASAICDLKDLFTRYQYYDAIIFGHAKDGNIHFVITEHFNNVNIDRYERFINDVVQLVVKKYDGSLKAEHGTGRNMAPFVQTEWGEHAYDMIKRIKQVIDPWSLLNPGVIINDDPRAHVKHLKQMPEVEEEVDKCIECGYCEHRCPSRDITTSPRRRIVVRRALKLLLQNGEKAKHKQLLRQYEYAGLQTCALDGLCATECPVDINTGDLVKRLRRENHSRLANAIALLAARNFRTVEHLFRLAIKAGCNINTLIGHLTMTTFTRQMRKVFPSLPLWSPDLNPPPRLRNLYQVSKKTHGKNEIVYFPACVSRLLGIYHNKEKSLIATFLSVCKKCGIDATIIDKVAGSCCSQIFGSKGLVNAQVYLANAITERLWLSSKKGSLLIVTDVSSCAFTLNQLEPFLTPKNKTKMRLMKIVDSVDFLHDSIVPHLVDVNMKDKVVLHPACSLIKSNTAWKLEAIARRFAKEVTVPQSAGCCGMAGDRGFLFPELTASATYNEANEVKAGQFDGYYSSTITCEMALSSAVGQTYTSILYLVDEGLPPLRSDLLSGIDSKPHECTDKQNA